ncbi:MAG: helix-turn-helix domain-containing protein [Chloroherpetonaceae bacterium]|nr:helix-turn-helix domain-containing protein [Chloroherpetonaceae bacterium]MCS7210822.1 helix-turn-helix domain-containing protein [Chloroherpetonaceae bacterium]MDW8020489.1 helix-turn-helix domain-containing protein [Chloroherpetonaceae bacterium]MDW8465361.1 helix-turn-helix domain-containing protein [Chloroherpetonaceae bacterium]
MEHLNLARELADARTEQQLSLHDISQRTKIQVEHLQKLESGCYDFLPSFYVRQIVRKYAECLGLSVDTVNLYLAALEAHYAARQAAAAEQTPAPPSTTRLEWLARFLSPSRLMVASGTLVLMSLGIGIYTCTSPEEAKVVRTVKGWVSSVSKVEAITNSPKSKPTLPLPTVDAVSLPATQASGLSTASPRKLTLVVRAKSDCWVGVVADERKMQEAYLRANESSQFEADSLVKLTLGKAEVAEVWLNGKSIELPKRSGVVSNLRFSLSDVISH